uniref:Uncharacterized protein n=1 Tax=Rhizophora mucronata TaxID=61149 RepID=A0A2P2M7C1_RHIMU
MLLLLKDKDYISSNCIRRLISFSWERDFLSILHALLHYHFQHLLLRNNLFSLTLWASILVPY